MKASHKMWCYYYNAIDFLKANRIKLIVLLLFFLVACVMGIRAGCSVDAYAVLSGRTNFVLLLDAAKRNVAGYVFSNLFFFSLCWLAIMLLGLNFYVSFLGCLIYFYVVYTMGYAIAVYIVYFKLAALPYIIVCYIPHCFILCFGMECAVSTALECGCEMRRCGYFYIGIFKEKLMRALPPLVIILIAVLFEGIFGGIFTIGLII